MEPSVREAEAAFLQDARRSLERTDKASRAAVLEQLLTDLESRSGRHGKWKQRGWGWIILVSLTVLLNAHAVRMGYVKSPAKRFQEALAKPCLYKAWMFLLETSRHPSNCRATCGGLSSSGEVDIEYYHNLTKERFAKVYAEPARPVIVRNATFDWPAMAHFNLSFFRDLYDKYPDSYAPHHYRSKLLPFRLSRNYSSRLYDALHMTEEDQAKPWYFGWSNVDLNVHFELQKYYKIPQFLPDDTEFGQMEWFFMGTSQEAAYLHIDHTVKPAWQAQIRGRKIWELHPPAECAFQCGSPIAAHLQEGDIFVVDPSVWYHGTFVYPGELSLTFAMEFV